ncbi:hypothetical protein JCM33374_g2627 [Metschnikowia sp. JCM 33374]|nr:hypothetical protein JCM33374_g2627 [Metschnikowia sp. JCM 33374]
MTKQNSTPAVPHELVLPSYTLDSALVLLPGILYSVSLPRFKAAAFLARYREKIGTVPAVKALLAEYAFDTADSEIPVLSPDALAGITKFHSAGPHARSAMPSTADTKTESPSDLDWLLVAVFPNLARISAANDTQTGPGDADVATVCRVVSLSDDSNSIKLTLQAILRAQKTASRNPKTTECVFALTWSDHIAPDTSAIVRKLQISTTLLFSSIDSFLDKYRNALTKKGKDADLLTLNPLANALFLQLAGSNDFDKAYTALQKICESGNTTESARGLSRIIDLTVAIVPFPNTEKLRVLSTIPLEKRALKADSMMGKMAAVFQEISTNSSMINHWFHGEASQIQKANLVANQLKSIRVILEGLTSNTKTSPAQQKQLLRRKSGAAAFPSKKLSGSRMNDDESGDGHNDDDDDEDDLRLITEFIKNQLPRITSISDDSKRLLVKDFRRIKNSPPGNGDFHVIRNYLEIVADMPWDKYVARFLSNKDINLADAKTRLDEDHYGLQHVKTRLIQYLVVLKLLGTNAEKEYNESGLKEAERKRQLKEQMESRKFTRESTNGESIIVPSHEENETRSMNDEDDSATLPVNHSANEEKESVDKALLASKNNKSPIIMLAGPPGVGKTSLAKSIASTLGRNFQRISLGGVRDESEIRGHRRTYIGAMAGSIVQALRKSRSMNPVILLDEIDKVVGGHNSGNKLNGDPAAALLEVLDPEQNTHFVDHFLGFPIDLSQVIFICTANDPHNLSRPLLDRLEMIEVGAYDYNEKLVIGNKKSFLSTREEGVRNLERSLGTICRFKAVEYSESLADINKEYQPKVEEFDLARYLGLPFPSLSNEIVEFPLMSTRYGVVNGMSYNTDGSGSVLIFESIGFNNGKGSTSLNMTGRLGEVLMESAKIGLTFIKNTLYKRLLNLEDTESLLKKLNNLEIHMHVPSGAVQKDGPSAGITMALSFLSLILQKPVPSNIAMTGEITLRGLVLPIGGLKEKVLGAHLTGQIEKVIVPRKNRRDILEEYVHKINDSSQLNGLLKDNKSVEFKDSSPEDYFADKYGVKIVYAKEFWDVIKHVWGDELLANVEHSRLQEYHL